jgi:hypothetical protein
VQRDQPGMPEAERGAALRALLRALRLR